MNTLAGKTAIVTGASHVDGRAAALALAKAGAQVIVHYGNGARDADALVAEIRTIVSRSDAIASDLSVPDGPHRLLLRVGPALKERRTHGRPQPSAICPDACLQSMPACLESLLSAASQRLH
ncbi:SDR family NAD(P)-dependent oxidoreductase [Paraburkholderia sp.]|uniref:SDR family NAD(P)-dependent oxidoreductase n=1 Tax=Paraburkholderia sp. TaxID=1926495 RepID=UPI002F3F8C08